MRIRRTPLAWRSITHDKKRFVLSLAGIMFATILMFVQLGFLNAIFDSQVELIHRLNADIVITNSSKHHLSVFEPFARRRLEQALGTPGVGAVYPVYIEGTLSQWKNPNTRESRVIRAVGIDPADPAFLDPDVNAARSSLQQQETVLMDSRSKPAFGPLTPGTRTELAGRRVRVAGNFSLGTDFDYDGTVIMSESNFLEYFPSQRAADSELGRVELGLVRLQKGADLAAVQAALKNALPHDIRVWTKQELIDQEVFFWQTYTPIGFVFGLGLAIGFAVGVVICSQILYTGVVDRMPLFGTLKAIGYTNGYLIRLVGSEALLLSLISFVPGTALSWGLYRFLVSLIGFEMFLTGPRILLILVFTLGMSLLAAFVALRKALTADPAEVFK